jgi:DNA-binding NarL/FixJ family response regulator
MIAGKRILTNSFKTDAYLGRDSYTWEEDRSHVPEAGRCSANAGSASAGIPAKSDNNLNGRSRSRSIVIVHPSTCFRDCFARCLETAYSTHRLIKFATVSDWQHSTSTANGSYAEVAIIFVEGDKDSIENDLQSLHDVTQFASVIVISEREDAGWVRSIIRSGARGYIPTSLSFGIVVEAVRLVLAGGTFVPASAFDGDIDQEMAAQKPTELLTPRQTMVVEALCMGLANKQIAFQLGMSEHTVKVHLRKIMNMLKARNRTELALLAQRLASRESGERVRRS